MTETNDTGKIFLFDLNVTLTAFVNGTERTAQFVRGSEYDWEFKTKTIGCCGQGYKTTYFVNAVDVEGNHLVFPVEGELGFEANKGQYEVVEEPLGETYYPTYIDWGKEPYLRTEHRKKRKEDNPGA